MEEARLVPHNKRLSPKKSSVSLFWSLYKSKLSTGKVFRSYGHKRAQAVKCPITPNLIALKVKLRTVFWNPVYFRKPRIACIFLRA